MNTRKHSFFLRTGLLLPSIITLAAPAAAIAANAHVDENAKSKAAVIAVDDHWMRAEVNGDTAWLDSMLLPGYRTVNSNGKIGTKARLLESAAKNRNSDKMRKQVEAWKATHKTKTGVVIQGDTALLTFSDPETGRIRSSDLFIYKDGGWHALYSQHSKVE